MSIDVGEDEVHALLGRHLEHLPAITPLTGGTFDAGLRIQKSAPAAGPWFLEMRLYRNVSARTSSPSEYLSPFEYLASFERLPGWTWGPTGSRANVPDLRGSTIEGERGDLWLKAAVLISQEHDLAVHFELHDTADRAEAMALHLMMQSFKVLPVSAP